MKSLKELCTPRPSVFAADRRATVLNLDTFLIGEIQGAEFFDENFFTNGMLTLVDRASTATCGYRAATATRGYRAATAT